MKIINIEEYIKQHAFLEESAEFYKKLDKAVEFITPIEFPNIDECKKLVEDGVPLVQHEPLQTKMTYALKPLLLQVDIDASNEITERILKWSIISKLIPDAVKSSDVWEGWLKNYCPVCGRKPVLAQLRKQNEGRARYLKCGGCGTMWRWNRLGCTYCDNEDLTKMHILEIEAEPQMRIDVCDKCHSYLKTYNEEGNEHIYLTDWLTLHFDLLAEDENLHKVGSVLIE